VAFVQRSARSVTYRHQARVILHASADQIASRQHWLRDDLEPLGEDRCAYETSDDSLEWLALRIAFLGVDFEVVEPPELADWCGHVAERFRRAAGTGGP
jgi:predicted DNA-binding transcriptional regulator YafY